MYTVLVTAPGQSTEREDKGELGYIAEETSVLPRSTVAPKLSMLEMKINSLPSARNLSRRPLLCREW